MSDVTMRRRAASGGAFNRGTMLLIVAVGTLAFVAMLALAAYAPDLRSGRNGGAHALSNAATGFSGVVRLAEATGRNPQIIRADHLLESEALVVLTPESGQVNLTEVLQTRAGKATLVVLPKWNTEADELRSGWVRARGLLPAYQPQTVLAPAVPMSVARAKSAREPLSTVPGHASADIAFRAPPVIQTVAGPRLNPIVTGSAGRILLAQVEQLPFFVLADPDLLNNRGMADKNQAAAALALLDFLNSTDAEQILFDVTLNGLGRSRSPLRLAFEPPFLPVTIAIFVALLLAGLQGITRFGAPQHPRRAIAFGKRALVDNSAALVRKAGREVHLGGRFASVIRDRAAALFKLPGHLPPDEIDQRLDALKPAPSFSSLAAVAAEARHRDELLAAARELHHWVEEVKA